MRSPSPPPPAAGVCMNACHAWAARAADVSRATVFFNHFTCKEDLLLGRAPGLPDAGIAAAMAVASRS
ncbi:MAG TPA: hypothetical protein VMI94_24290 [Bryobacteraceae bacterium]|nr:hypothetical protein [Bryobacteraceae bacterium]